MAGFFSSISNGMKGLLGQDALPRLLAAQAISNGDYSTAARMIQYGKESAAERQKQEAEAVAKQQTHDALVAAAKAHGMSDLDAEAIAQDTSAGAGYVRDVSKPWEVGASGGSRFDPVTKGWVTAPRWDGDNNYFGPSTDPSQAPERIVKGTKAVPVAAGGELHIVDSLTGAPVGAGGAQSSGPAPGSIEDGFQYMGGDPADKNNWKPVGGGAVNRGSATFPGPY